MITTKGSPITGIILAFALVISFLPLLVNNNPALALERDWAICIWHKEPDPEATSGFRDVCEWWWLDPEPGLPGFPRLYEPLPYHFNPVKPKPAVSIQDILQKYGYLECDPPADNIVNCYYLDEWGRFERDLCKSTIDTLCKTLASSECSVKTVRQFLLEPSDIPGLFKSGATCALTAYHKCIGTTQPTDAACDNIVKSQRKLIVSYPVD